MMMSAHDSGGPSRADFALWAFCMLAVLGLHGGAVFWLRDINPPKIGVPTPPPPILLELAPEPVAPPPPLEPSPPEPPPPQAAPEPPPPEPEPPPPPKREEPAVVPDVVLRVPKPPPVRRPPPPPRPVVHEPPPVERPVAPPVAAPPVSAPPAPVAAAPPTGAVAARWQSAVAAYIARFRQYPVSAQRRGDEGVALVHFSVDRAGNVSSVSLVRSSGHPDLDSEATAWVARAQPVPAPPPEITQSRIELVIPLRFELH
jgi:protein TonB